VTSLFDTIAAVRRLEDAGLSREAAEAITSGDLEASGAGHNTLATKKDLTELATKADLYRALWLQAAGIVSAITALAGIAVALDSLLGKASQ